MAIFKKNMEYLMLAAVCIVAFFPVLNNDFLYSWDDQWMVMNEYTEGGINIRNLKLLLTSIYHGQYAPVNQLLFLFLYNTVGYNAFYFHLTSLILHISCVCFVYTMAIGEPLPMWLLVYPPLVVIILVTLKNFLLKKPYAFGVLFFLLHIAITLHIIPLSRFAIVADRYIYLASIGLAFIIACCFVWVRGLHNGKYKLIL